MMNDTIIKPRISVLIMHVFTTESSNLFYLMQLIIGNANLHLPIADASTLLLKTEQPRMIHVTLES